MTLVRDLLERVARKTLRICGDSLTELSDAWQDAILSRQKRSEDDQRNLLHRFLTRDAMRRAVRALDIDLVIDVGANRGDFAAAIRSVGYRGDLLCVEPNPEAFRGLCGACRGTSSTYLRNVAVGSHQGTLNLNIAEQDVFSSALTPNENARELFGDASKIRKTLQVAQVPLCDLLLDLETSQNKRYSRLFVKSDTQGFDCVVVASLQTYLGKAKAMLVEIPVIEIYNHSESLEVSLRRYRDLGFSLAHVCPVSWTKKDEIVEVDCLFVKRDVSMKDGFGHPRSESDGNG